VLVAQPLRVDEGGLPGVSQGDAVVAGAGGQVRAQDPGFGLDLVEGLPRGGVLAVEELAGEQRCVRDPAIFPGGWLDGRVTPEGAVGLKRTTDRIAPVFYRYQRRNDQELPWED
jgi:hypothetical protein